jgi:hypothetical protein
MQQIGYSCAEADDPYAAMAELCRRPTIYRAVILSVSSIHREELAVIPGIKRRFPHVEVWLTHTDGRQSALAEAMRLGADGLLSGEGLHRVALPAGGAPPYVPGPSVEGPVSAPLGEARGAAASADVASADAESPATESPAATPAAAPAHDATAGQARAEEEPNAIGEPVLTADELRALLQEQPLPPPVGSGE